MSNPRQVRILPPAKLTPQEEDGFAECFSEGRDDPDWPEYLIFLEHLKARRGSLSDVLAVIVASASGDGPAWHHGRHAAKDAAKSRERRLGKRLREVAAEVRWCFALDQPLYDAANGSLIPPNEDATALVALLDRVAAHSRLTPPSHRPTEKLGDARRQLRALDPPVPAGDVEFLLTPIRRKPTAPVRREPATRRTTAK